MPSLFDQTFQWRGLWVVGGKEKAPAGALRRARGVQRTPTGPIVSRDGSTLVSSLDAHSLFRFNDKRYAGQTTAFFEDGSSIKTGLDASRLVMVRMPPTAAKQDFLFVAGGGDLFKVSPAGVVTAWGIVKPASTTSAADDGAGTMAAGVYQYKITFLNTISGHRSNGNDTAASVTIGGSRSVALTVIPTSSDSQVNAREIWRTVADGAVFFRLAQINDNSTTTYDDDDVDVNLESTELPTDNDPPDDTYEWAAGPFDARMWWAGNTASGTGGRLYFSPVGRPESVEGFLEASNTDDPTQAVVIWNGLWVFTEKTIKRVVSTLARPIETGAPGTRKPFTIQATPFGIMYEADDGLRLFDGRTSRLVGLDAIGTLFQGAAAENLTAMDGVVSGFAREEYLISDESQTLALNARLGTWRDLGLGIKAFHFEADTDELQVSFSGKVFLFEDEGVLTDDGTAISFIVEPPSLAIGKTSPGLLQRLVFDIDTNDQSLTPTLLLDGTTVTLADIITSGRATVEFPVLQDGRLVGVRLTGSLTKKVTIYDIVAEVYAATVAA